MMLSGPGKSRVLRLVWSNPNPVKVSGRRPDVVFIDEATVITKEDWDKWLEQTIPKKDVDWQSSLF